MMDDLGKRVARSGAWLFGMRLVHQILYLGRLIILARLLAPKDFGLMGIALLTMMTLETFSQTGFEQALIQKKKHTEDYLDTAWTVLVIRGIILFVIILLIAPLVAKFFETSAAKGVVQAIGLAILIQAFTNVGVVYFQKELEFHKQFIYITAGTATDFVVAVTAAILMKSVWALLFGLLAGKSVQLILSYIIHPYRPKISKDFHKARELFGFGKWVLGSTVLAFLITQGDDLLVGKILGATMLGFYQMAYKLSNTPATEITFIINKVTLPAYSKLQEDISKIKEAYLKVLQFVSFLIFPLAFLIFALSPDFTRIFLGEKWMPMVPAMQILVFSGLLRSLVATTTPVFFGVGKPKIDTKWQLVRFFTLAALIYPFIIKKGIIGVSYVVLISLIISGIGFISSVIKIIHCRFLFFLKRIVLPLIGSILLLISIIIFKSFFKTIDFTYFILICLICILLYVVFIYIADRILKLRLVELLLEQYKLIRLTSYDE